MTPSKRDLTPEQTAIAIRRYQHELEEQACLVDDNGSAIRIDGVLALASGNLISADEFNKFFDELLEFIVSKGFYFGGGFGMLKEETDE